jgi:hypothetical protein
VYELQCLDYEVRAGLLTEQSARNMLCFGGITFQFMELLLAVNGLKEHFSSQNHLVWGKLSDARANFSSGV